MQNKENRNTEVYDGGGFEPVKPAREPGSSRPKPRASLKNAPRQKYTTATVFSDVKAKERRYMMTGVTNYQ